MTGQLFFGLLLSAVVGGLGYWRQALTLSGFVGAVLVGTLIFGFGGWIWGLLLITFFVSSSVLSHYRLADRGPVLLGTGAVAGKSAKGSSRDLGQALANGGVGAMLAVAFAIYPSPLFFAAFLGVIGTANADTWATELGVLSRVPPRLITTGEEVSPGTSGGVTWLGIWASVAGALLIGIVAMALTQIWALLSGTGWMSQAVALVRTLSAIRTLSADTVNRLQPLVVSLPLLAVVGGLVGSLFDSLLGATVQGIYHCDHCAKETEHRFHVCGTRPGGHPPRRATTHLVRGWAWLNNDIVNLMASLLGGLVSAALAWLLWK